MDDAPATAFPQAAGHGGHRHQGRSSLPAAIRLRRSVNASGEPTRRGRRRLAEWLFRILFGFRRNVRPRTLFNVRSTEEDSMKKFGFVIAALGALVIAAPSIASAETIVIKRGGHHHGAYGARAEYRGHDRGWHRGWNHGHGNNVVVIKKRYHSY
jgi:hypothetical protein